MDTPQHHAEEEDADDTTLLLRNTPGPGLSLNQQSTNFNEKHDNPRQQYAYIAAQGSSRIHAGNSYVEQ